MNYHIQRNRVSFLADEAFKEIEKKVEECIKIYCIENRVFDPEDILEIFADSFQDMSRKIDEKYYS